MLSGRIAVTGVGCVSPAGADADATFAALLEGRSSCRPMDFDTHGGPPGAGAPVAATTAELLGDPKAARRIDRGAAFGVTAAREAWRRASVGEVAPERIGVVVGSGAGGLSSWERLQLAWTEKGYAAVSPFVVPMVMPNSATAEIAIALGAQGPSWTVGGACAAGTYAVIEGCRLINEGSADVVVAVGADALLTPTIYSAFARMGATSRQVDPGASRPFDVARDGFALGEGGGALVLESARRAADRGAQVLAEIAGYGVTTDAFHIVAPDPEGGGASRAMQMAMAQAQLAPAEFGHVNAHGTSTTLNDLAESIALARCFGADGPVVTSCKGAIGHLLGGAGAVEMVVTVMSVCSGLVPPIANTETLDPALSYSSMQVGESLRLGPRPALKNSFAFGGHNASVAVVPGGWPRTAGAGPDG